MFRLLSWVRGVSGAGGLFLFWQGRSDMSGGDPFMGALWWTMAAALLIVAALAYGPIQEVANPHRIATAVAVLVVWAGCSVYAYRTAAVTGGCPFRC
jgi:hypothetical protein